MVWETSPEQGARIVGAIVELVLTDNQPGIREAHLTALKNLAYVHGSRPRLVTYKERIVLEALQKSMSRDTTKARRRAAVASTYKPCPAMWWKPPCRPLLETLHPNFVSRRDCQKIVWQWPVTTASWIRLRTCATALTDIMRFGLTNQPFYLRSYSTVREKGTTIKEQQHGIPVTVGLGMMTRMWICSQGCLTWFPVMCRALTKPITIAAAWVPFSASESHSVFCSTCCSTFYFPSLILIKFVLK